MDIPEKRKQTSKKRKKKMPPVIIAALKIIEELSAPPKPVPWFIQSGYYRETYCNLQ